MTRPDSEKKKKYGQRKEKRLLTLTVKKIIMDKKILTLAVKKLTDPDSEKKC